MGQYFLLVNEDKKEYVSPWAIDGGGKLWEWIANIDECGVITSLVLDGWGGDNIVLIGDYDESKLYDVVEKSYKEISKRAKSLFMKNKDIIRSKSKIYAINETTKEYVYGSFKQVSMCLTLLLRKSSEGGGGDIYNDYESAGAWAENKIVIKSEKPSKKYADINSAVYKEAFDFYNG